MRMIPVLLACALAVPAAAQADERGEGGELICRQQLERTAAYFQQRRSGLDPRLARSIENDLRVYETQCHTPSNGMIAGRLADIRKVIDGEASAEILPNPPRR